MTINPGELDKKIEIVRRRRTEDADGYYAEDRETVHSCWAKFSRKSGTELNRADSDFAQVDVRFLIRYTPKKLDRKMAVLYEEQCYEIQYLNEYGDCREYIEIWARLLTREAGT